MSLFASVLICLAMLGILVIADKKIKGKKSVLIKIASFLFFSIFLVAIIYFYGSTIIESFSVNLKSFGKVRSFVLSKLIAFAMMLLLFLFVFAKAIHVTIKFILSKERKEKKSETIDINTVSFDIDTVPDNCNSVSVKSFLRFNKFKEIKAI